MDDVSAREAEQIRPAPGQSAMRIAVDAVDDAPPRTLIGRLFGVSPLGRGREAYLQTVGELEVATLLDHLGDEWAVMHSVPVGGGPDLVDHLVIGPPGVFVVDTTVHPGAHVVADQRSFVVQDVRLPAIRAMEFEMGRVERLLGEAAGAPVEVSGVLAVVESRSLTVHEQHRDVAVVRAPVLDRWLQQAPRRLSPERVLALAAIARRADTWDVSVAQCADLDELRARFDALHRRVRSARRVQRVWTSLATLAAAGGFVALTYAILLRTMTP